MDLIAELRAALGDAQVLTGADAARKAQDPTGKYRWQPLALVRPADTVEVAAVLRLAGAAGAAVVPVSGNTGLAGGTRAEGAIMLSLERMNRIREIRQEAADHQTEGGFREEPRVEGVQGRAHLPSIKAKE